MAWRGKRRYRRRYASGYYAASAAVRRYLAQKRRDQQYLEYMTNTADALSHKDELKEIADKIKFRGRGAYTSGYGAFKLGKIARKIGKVGLAAASSGLLGPQAAMAAGIVGNVTGLGAYEGSTVYNDTFPQMNEGGAPRFAGSATDEVGSIVISDTEYLGDLLATNTYDSTVFTIQPTLFETFPFLSQIAPNYSEYEIIQLALTYSNKMSNVTDTGSLGTVMMYPEYNPSTTEADDKWSLMGRTNCVSAKPTQDVVCGFECDPSKNSGTYGKYIRVGEVPTGESVKDYDAGKFIVATQGMPTSTVGQVIGEIWISYTVRLRKPRLYSVLGQAHLSDTYLINDADATTDFESAPVESTAQTAWVPLTTPILASPENNLGTNIYCGWYRHNTTADAMFAFKIGFPSTTLNQAYKITIRCTTTSFNNNARCVSLSYKNMSKCYERMCGFIYPEGTYQDFLHSTAATGTINDSYTFHSTRTPTGGVQDEVSGMVDSPNVSDNKGFYWSTCLKLDNSFGTASYCYISIPACGAAEAAFNFDRTVINIEQVKNYTGVPGTQTSKSSTAMYGKWVEVLNTTTNDNE